VAVSKRAMRAGEILDGEGGYTVSGGLRPASLSVANGYLPLGLAHNVTLRRDVAENVPVSWDDVEIDASTDAYRLRKQVEAMVETASAP
jgi:predicted homoserine dehydrogenase-like protein